MLANQALNYLVSGKVPRRMGNAHPNITPYQIFPVADGHIIIASGNDNQFAKLCAVLGAPELAKEPAYKDNKARLANRTELVACICTLTARMSRTELLAKLEAAGVPAGPINDLDQVFSDPQVDPPRHAARAAERARRRRKNSRRAHADRARRSPDGGGAPVAAARRAHRRNSARDR